MHPNVQLCNRNSYTSTGLNTRTDNSTCKQGRTQVTAHASRVTHNASTFAHKARHAQKLSPCGHRYNIVGQHVHSQHCISTTTCTTALDHGNGHKFCLGLHSVHVQHQLAHFAPMHKSGTAQKVDVTPLHTVAMGSAKNMNKHTCTANKYAVNSIGDNVHHTRAPGTGATISCNSAGCHPAAHNTGSRAVLSML